MTEHPIIFSTNMVKAILEGRKTMTRRVVKPQPLDDIEIWSLPTGQWITCKTKRRIDDSIKCPYGQVGGTLWVRETWAEREFLAGGNVCSEYYYKAGNPDDKNIIQTRSKSSSPRKTKIKNTSEYGKNLDLLFAKKISQKEFHRRTQPKWKPSIHMPYVASRINLRIVDISVEKLQDISEHDAILEGFIPNYKNNTALNMFYQTWNSLNAKRGYSWKSNPWVWVIEFKKL